MSQSKKEKILKKKTSHDVMWQQQKKKQKIVCYNYFKWQNGVHEYLTGNDGVTRESYV